MVRLTPISCHHGADRRLKRQNTTNQTTKTEKEREKMDQQVKILFQDGKAQFYVDGELIDEMPEENVEIGKGNEGVPVSEYVSKLEKANEDE